jgi:peptidoglycan LD-endopeptidase LytH
MTLDQILRRNQDLFHPVVPFDFLMDKLHKLDLTANNTELTADIYSSTELFSEYIDKLRDRHHARYLVGGYDELRQMYVRSDLFGANDSSSAHVEEPRRLHLGIDLWGPAGTPVSAPLDGTVHSFKFNDRFGDYGATIILMHQIDGYTFHSLYGHLSLRDISNLEVATSLSKGTEFAHFGNLHENGQWPPHLHFQLIHDIGAFVGDYPGVCKYSEREKYLKNCPDPEIILQFNKNPAAAG